MYSVQKICHQCGISQQTFYRLARDNAEFKSVIENNRTQQPGKKRFGYDQPVLDWLLAHYDNHAVESPETAPDPSNIQVQRTSSVEKQAAYRASEGKTEHIDIDSASTIATLEAKVQTLEERLKDKQALIATLQQTIVSLRTQDQAKDELIAMLKTTSENVDQAREELVTSLKESLSQAENDKAAQAQQIGMLLMTLHEEREERKLLLGQPKQGFWKKLFHRHKDD